MSVHIQSEDGKTATPLAATASTTTPAIPAIEMQANSLPPTAGMNPAHMGQITPIVNNGTVQLQGQQNNDDDDDEQSKFKYCTMCT